MNQVNKMRKEFHTVGQHRTKQKDKVQGMQRGRRKGKASNV